MPICLKSWENGGNIKKRNMCIGLYFMGTEGDRFCGKILNTCLASKLSPDIRYHEREKKIVACIYSLIKIGVESEWSGREEDETESERARQS